MPDYNNELPYRLIFLDKHFSFTRDNESLVCYLGIPLNLKPGTYRLVIKDKKKEMLDKLQIKVRKPGFPVEYVNFSSEKMKKIGSPKNKKERVMIIKALKTETSAKLWNDRFSVPVKGRIKGVFGAARKTGKTVLWQHKGIDISAEHGTPVKAPSSGKVILSQQDFNLHGKTVIIDHGIGVISLYIHLDEIAVSKGEMVKKGHLIGRVGNTGLTTAPNLHWGIYVHSNAVNPSWWLENR